MKVKDLLAKIQDVSIQAEVRFQFMDSDEVEWYTRFPDEVIIEKDEDGKVEAIILR